MVSRDMIGAERSGAGEKWENGEGALPIRDGAINQ
jgi:hypothetical protein